MEPLPKLAAQYELTDEEQHMLLYMADHEDNSSIEGLQAVMQVAINRLTSEKFPSTLADVLFQPRQFYVMSQYSSNYEPSEEAEEALHRLLYSDNIFAGEEALFFAASRVKPSNIARGLYIIVEIGGTRFWGQD